MRILLVIPYLPAGVVPGSERLPLYNDVLVGGAETWGINFALSLVRAGHDVTLATANLPRPEESADLVYRGIDVRALPFALRYDVVPCFGDSLVQIYNSAEFDAFHVSLFAHTDLVGITAHAQIHGIPVVFSHHGCGIISDDPVERGLILQSLRHLTAITVPSTSSLVHYPSEFHDKIVVVPNGVDMSTYYPKGADTSRDLHQILYVGRILPHKGIEYLVEAVLKLRSEGVPVQLKIAGTGEHKINIERLVSKLGLAEFVHFLGYVEDERLPELYRDSDVFVLPSSTKLYDGRTAVEPEAFGIVLIEAMASGIPVIAFDIPGVSSVIQNGYNGMLASNADSASLAEVIGSVVTNERLRLQVVVGGTKTAETYSWTSIIEDFELLYEMGRHRRNNDQGLTKTQILFLIPSTTQVNSGQGRHIFELIKRISSRCGIVTDNKNVSNTLQLLRYSRGLDVEVLCLEGKESHLSPDPLVPELYEVLCNTPANTKFVVVGWANTFYASAALLSSDGRAIVYLPYYQPTWTVPGLKRYTSQISLIERLVARHSSVAFPMTSSEADVLLGLGTDRSVVIPGGVDTTFFKPASVPKKSSGDLLFVGDINEWGRKDVPRLAEFFAECCKRGFTGRLQLVTNRPIKEDIKDRFLRLVPRKLRARIVIMGRVTDDELRDLYQKSAFLVMMSRYEAFGIPLVEAMACGTPIISTATLAARDLLYSDHVGILVDSNEHAAKRAMDLLSDVEEYNIISNRCREVAQKSYDWRIIAKTFGESLVTATVPRQLNIVHMNDWFYPDEIGGVETYLQELCNIQTGMGHSVIVIRAGDQYRQYKIGQISVIELGEYSSVKVDKLPGDLQKVIRHADVLHIHSSRNFVGLAGDIAELRPVVLDIHDHWSVCANNELIYLPSMEPCSVQSPHEQCNLCVGSSTVGIMRGRERLVSNASQIIVHSDFMRTKLIQKYPDLSDKVKVVPIGIDVEKFSFSQARRGQPFVVSYVGRPSWTKGIHLLTPLMDELKFELRKGEIAVQIASNLQENAPLYEEFRAYLAREGLERQVRVLGKVPHDEMNEVYTSSDVVLMLSTWSEPAGIVPLESMYCGTPVILSKVGALPEIMPDGLVVESGDLKHVAALIRKLKDDNGFWSDMSTRGMTRVRDKYKRTDMIGRLMGLYREAYSVEQFHLN